MIITLITALSLAQAVDQGAVDRAIALGIEHLRTRLDDLGDDRGASERYKKLHELVLLTMVHGGVAEGDPQLQKLLAKVLDEPLAWTYRVSLQAMVLERVDAAKHQRRLARCAQFLVDNQAESGGWGYGKPVEMPPDLEAPDRDRADVATGGGSAAPRPRKAPPISIRKRQNGDKSVDNSNSQYAALGMRACAGAGVVFEPRVLKLGRGYWESAQREDGGWCYKGKSGSHAEHESYGSMTAGGMGSLCIYVFLLGERWQNDARVERARRWMTTNFTVERNPGTNDHGGKPDYMHLYYLYGLERAGILYGTEKFGAHEWYPEGARLLLAAQRGDGSWDGSVRDTCFAILFLRRGTKPLDVATGK
jgi:hypothetical protein